MPRLRSFGCGILLAVLLLPLGACGGRSRAPRNILLITVDTLRHDRVGFLGGARPTSPELDRLAAESIVYPNAWSISGWTLPSIGSILTGREPMQHGATDFHFKLNPNLPTLASILSEQGYDTRGYVSHILLSPTYGMNKGFQRFDSSVLQRGNPHEISTSRELTDLALKDLADLREPYFVWLHYFDPHFEYLAHEPWRQFGDTESDRYDQEIAYTDQQIGRVLAHFREAGLLDRTLVAFTADHGEEFGEHGGEYHETCYDEVLRVPLCLRVPGRTATRDERPAAQTDLLPTLLHAIGVEPAEEYAGADLLAPTAAPAPLFVERDRPPGHRQRAVLDGRWKLIHVVESDTLAIPEASRGTFAAVRNVSAGTWLFDLAADPGESRNLIADQPAEAARLAELLSRHYAGQLSPAGSVVVSPEMRERLKSLGYIR